MLASDHGDLSGCPRKSESTEISLNNVMEVVFITFQVPEQLHGHSSETRDLSDLIMSAKAKHCAQHTERPQKYMAGILSQQQKF